MRSMRFCRAVDDIADDGGPREPRRAALDRWRTDIDALFEGRITELTRDLDAPTKRFALRREDFHAVIDGMQMDLEADLCKRRTGRRSIFIATAWRALSAAFRCASSASSREAGDALAHHLGRALQLTNILRDIDEDAEIGPALSAARGADRRRHRDRRPRAGGDPFRARSRRGLPRRRRARRGAFRRSRQDHERAVRAGRCARRASWRPPTGRS